MHKFFSHSCLILVLLRDNMSKYFAWLFVTPGSLNLDHNCDGAAIIFPAKTVMKMRNSKKKSLMLLARWKISFTVFHLIWCVACKAISEVENVPRRWSSYTPTMALALWCWARGQWLKGSFSSGAPVFLQLPLWVFHGTLSLQHGVQNIKAQSFSDCVCDHTRQFEFHLIDGAMFSAGLFGHILASKVTWWRNLKLSFCLGISVALLLFLWHPLMNIEPVYSRAHKCLIIMNEDNMMLIISMWPIASCLK